MTTVAIIGGGAAGVVTAAHLARRWPADRPLRVLMYDAGDRPARGVAYATNDPRHRLNVPASGMSALSDDPDDFVGWLAARDPAATGADFRPRAEYGDYLADTLADCAAAIGLVGRRTAVTEMTRAGVGWRVAHGTGDDRADACVLAVGHAPSLDPEGVESPDAAGYIRDPWAPGALADLLDATRPGDVVLLIGSGLTAVDVALSLTAQGRRVVAVSRHGWLPRRHRSPAADPVPLAADTGMPATAVELVRLVADHLRAAEAGGGGWRAGVDGLRPVTAELWAALPAAERRKLLAGPVRQWEVLRHRVGPEVADAVDRLRASGAFRVVAAQICSAAGEERAWRVAIRRAGWVDQLSVAAVVNCTGPSCDISRYPGGFGRRLLEAGHVVAHELTLGVRTTAEGAVIDSHGRADDRLWALGALRRGELYESTAMPELRAQAATIAERLAARFASSQSAPGVSEPDSQAGRVTRRPVLVPAAGSRPSDVPALLPSRPGRHSPGTRSTRKEPPGGS